MTALTLKAYRFMAANERSPVIYASIDGHCCVYRLLDGSTWRMSIRESREVGVPRFAHLTDPPSPKRIPQALQSIQKDERKLLKRMEREVLMQSELA